MTPRYRKVLFRVLLILLLIGIVWFFQLENDHALKSKFKAIIRAIT